MSMFVFVITGVSGSGKDTFADALRYFHKIHPIADMKRFWERHYCFHKFSFDDADVKLQPLSPSANCTVGEFQVKLWEFMKGIDPKTSLYFLETELKRSLNYKVYDGIVITGVRSMAEAQVIVDAVTCKSNTKLVTINIVRPGLEGKPSDQDVADVTRFLAVNSVYYEQVSNRLMKEDLENHAQALVKELI